MALANNPAMIMAAQAIQVTAAIQSPIVSLWTRDTKLRGSAVRLSRWNGTDDWSACLDGAGCQWNVARRGESLTVQRLGEIVKLGLHRVDPQAARRGAIDQDYRSAVRQYPYWRDLIAWRIWATAMVVAAFLLAEALFILLLRKVRFVSARIHRYLEVIHNSMPVFWSIVGAAVVFLYFGR
jgi:hypothetical protein